jgi:uncharacterized protein (DUF952 family)
MPIEPIYKIVDLPSWVAAEKRGCYDGSADDLRDGFIHFSTAVQARETAAKHFAGRTDLVIVAIDASQLGDALKWEPSRGGALFPHLYEPLSMAAVLWTRPLPLGDDGGHVFPTEMT